MFSEPLRDNILLGLPEDKVDLPGAIHSSVLEPDVALLEKGLDLLRVRRGHVLDVHAAVMRQRHRRRAEVGRVGNRKIDLVLGRHRPFEGHAVGLGRLVAVPVLDEEEKMLGVITVGVLRNGLNLLAVPSSAQVACIGALVIVALVIGWGCCKECAKDTKAQISLAEFG